MILTDEEIEALTVRNVDARVIEAAMIAKLCAEVERLKEVVNLQVENYAELKEQNEAQHGYFNSVMQERDALQAEVKHLNLHLKATQSGRDAALARLAEIENQEPAYLLTPDGKCYAYGSAQPLSAGHADATLLELYAAAGASPVQCPPEGEWANALAVSELPAVDEMIRNLIDDGTQDNAVCLVREILRIAKAASPVEPSQAGVVDPVMQRGISALQDVVDTLETYGKYHDDEGEFTRYLSDLLQAIATPQAAAQPPAPSDAAITYMTGYSDGREWVAAPQPKETK